VLVPVLGVVCGCGVCDWVCGACPEAGVAPAVLLVFGALLQSGITYVFEHFVCFL
jgi:hypothetical protein